MIDPQPCRAFLGQMLAGAEAIVELSIVVDVRERVPLRGALQRHVDHIVGEADARDRRIEWGEQVGYVDERIEASAAHLRSVAVETEAEVEQLACPNLAGGALQGFGTDVIERAALVG